MTNPKPLSVLRGDGWSTIPSSPGVYWWYFPLSSLSHLRVLPHCDYSQLKLRYSSDGQVCLYHGLAKNLAQRVAWHAAQQLTPSTLKSGYISTLRLTLLALNDFNYANGSKAINEYFDGLSIAWQTTQTREKAEEIEHSELCGPYHYPLNIRGNGRPNLASFVAYLKSARKTYRLQHLKTGLQHTA